jgi:hypothetical protein
MIWGPVDRQHPQFDHSQLLAQEDNDPHKVLEITRRSPGETWRWYRDQDGYCRTGSGPIDFRKSVARCALKKTLPGHKHRSVSSPSSRVILRAAAASNRWLPLGANLIAQSHQ